MSSKSSLIMLHSGVMIAPGAIKFVVPSFVLMKEISLDLSEVEKSGDINDVLVTKSVYVNSSFSFRVDSETFDVDSAPEDAIPIAVDKIKLIEHPKISALPTADKEALVAHLRRLGTYFSQKATAASIGSPTAAPGILVAEVAEEDTLEKINARIENRVAKTVEHLTKCGITHKAVSNILEDVPALMAELANYDCNASLIVSDLVGLPIKAYVSLEGASSADDSPETLQDADED